MEEFLQNWGYLGVFLGIVATGLGLPMPEELPVVIGGALVGWDKANFLMLPVCILGVVCGDSCLYAIGRLWGAKLVEMPFIQKHMLPPARLEKIRENFHKHGIKILLFARLTPGIRAPIFLTAGITHLPLHLFLLADGVYAIPGVCLLFFLGWYFTDRMIVWVQDMADVKQVIIAAVLLAVAGYFLYRFLRRPMVVGDPTDVPMQHTLEQLSKIVKPAADKEKDQTKVEQK